MLQLHALKNLDSLLGIKISLRNIIEADSSGQQFFFTVNSIHCVLAVKEDTTVYMISDMMHS